MAGHAFMDESKRQGRYMLCAGTVVSADAAANARDVLRAFKGSKRGLHMSEMYDGDRVKLAGLLVDLGVTSYIATAVGGTDRDRRDRLLRATVTHLARLGVRSLVIESCDQDGRDRQVLYEVLGPDPATAYTHRGKDELLLALPDIHAWCWGKGGRYRRIVAPVTVDLGRY